jgi:3-hydroxyacyl-CoA dehydrogenase
VDVMLAAYRMPFEAAVKYEEVAFVHLMNSHQSRGIRHVFFAERAATRIPRSLDTAGAPAAGKITKVGVVGAGTMGAGIATTFLLAGFDVVLSDISQATLQRAQEYIRRAVESAVRKGRLPERKGKAHEKLTQSLRMTTELSAHSDRELVVECVFESMSLKKQVFEQLSSIVQRGAILSSNTSTLDIDEIASTWKEA